MTANQLYKLEVRHPDLLFTPSAHGICYASCKQDKDHIAVLSNRGKIILNRAQAETLVQELLPVFDILAGCGREIMD